MLQYQMVWSLCIEWTTTNSLFWFMDIYCITINSVPLDTFLAGQFDCLGTVQNFIWTDILMEQTLWLITDLIRQKHNISLYPGDKFSNQFYIDRAQKVHKGHGKKKSIRGYFSRL